MRVIVVGTMGGVLSGAIAGAEYFLGSSGQPVVLASITSGQRLIRLGFSSSPTDLEIRLSDLGVR